MISELISASNAKPLLPRDGNRYANFAGNRFWTYTKEEEKVNRNMATPMHRIIARRQA